LGEEANKTKSGFPKSVRKEKSITQDKNEKTTREKTRPTPRPGENI
jgi:hypothetical protein